MIRQRRKRPRAPQAVAARSRGYYRVAPKRGGAKKPVTPKAAKGG